MTRDNRVFVLDIGTRSVMALLASLVEDELRVEHLIYKEHKNRSMLDGQIHNVDQVTAVVRELVQKMEQITGEKLRQVTVAAAGRSLITVRGTARMKSPVSTMLSKEEVLSLELQAVQEAQLGLPVNKDTHLSQHYYCVGYSVLEERLDGIKLGSIEGQSGQEAEIVVVATFLPRIVVNSLQTVVERVGLELIGITLEPIAVSNLVLNPAMRRLNLVMVDIGAGTSDIAVCDNDTISAFGMVPMAGDEITEAVSDRFLLDFNKAEEVKRLLEAEKEIKTVNVLGIEETLSSDQILHEMETAVNGLALAIAQEILKLNGKAPQAVLLVGGGSLTPGLANSLAKMLEVLEKRVAVQKANKLLKVQNLPDLCYGPNFITVLGIAYTAMACPAMGFISVVINDMPVRLLHLAKNNIAEALLAGGYNIRDYFGRPGLALTFEINGEVITVPGKQGHSGSIYLNGEIAQLGDTVKQGDNIVFIPGKEGEGARAKYRDVLMDWIGQCTVNNTIVFLEPEIQVGNKKVFLDDLISDGEKAEVKLKLTILDVLKKSGFVEKEPYVIVNGEKIFLLEKAQITKNGNRTVLNEVVKPGDEIIFRFADELTAGEFLSEHDSGIEISINGQKTLLRGTHISVNNVQANSFTPVKQGDIIEYKKNVAEYQLILVDVFNEISFSPCPPSGKTRLKILVNGEEKEYTYVLVEGDNIEIEWV